MLFYIKCSNFTSITLLTTSQWMYKYKYLLHTYLGLLDPAKEKNPLD